MKVVVITGSPDWSERGPIAGVVIGADIVIVGDCPTGADQIAHDVARQNGLPTEKFHRHRALDHGAQTECKAKNAAMASDAVGLRNDGHEITCHAFPTARAAGTWDCCNKLRKVGFSVTIHRELQ